MLGEIADRVRKQERFAFETTLAGLGYLAHNRRWREQGYRISLFFLSLPNADAAIARVAEPVRQGGRHITEDLIGRRFAAGLRNLELSYQRVVDAWGEI